MPSREIPTSARFPAASVLERQPAPGSEPNLWVPRQLEKEFKQLPMNDAQGKDSARRSLLKPQQRAAGHPFFPTLHEWATEGVPVDCGPAWSWDSIQAAIARGPHRSAMDEESMALVHEDIQYQVDAGFCKVVTWAEVQRLRPKNLKISPIAVVPQRDRRGRIILDLSFPVYPQDKKDRQPLQAGVNETTTKLAPQEPVQEIGQVFRRLLDLINGAEAGEVVMLAKIDLSDGFWRMIVQEDQQWNFAYVMPDPPGHPVRIVVPSALQMGWAESPAYFCAATETGRDIIQGLVDDETELPPHCLEHYMKPAKRAKRARADSPGRVGLYVYVDDYIAGVVENAEGTLLGRVARCALHGIHSIFPPPDVTGHEGGKDPVSIKKLKKGDAQWNHEKEILGFIVDGLNRTVRISESKSADIISEIRKILKKKNVQLRRYRRIVGKLRHVALIMPSTKGLFSPINKALQGEPKTIGLGKNSEVRAALLDLATMVKALGARPTHVKELVPDDDHYVGYCDACAAGAGGVWFSGDLHMDPIVWRVEFPPEISSQVVSDSNPTGNLTNSDLEMAAVLLHYMVLQQTTDMKHKRAGTFSDNTPTVSWSTRMADRSKSATAGRLLRGLAAIQRATQAGPFTVASVAGKKNQMADVASRSFHIRDDACFLTLFQTTFPLPQQQSWKIVHLMPAQISNVTSTLAGKRLPLPRWTTTYEQRTGRAGSSSPPMPAATPTCRTFQKPSSRTSLSVSLHGSGVGTTAEGLKSKLKPQKPPSVTWHKPSCWRDTPTPGKATDRRTSTSRSPDS
jgi:hypothetical protein